MTNQEWATGQAPVPKPKQILTEPTGGAGRRVGIITTPHTAYTPPGQVPRITKLYHTSHLMMFYFIEIEGEKGVTKIRKFLEKNRKQMRVVEKYNEAVKVYQTEWSAFVALPEVTKVDGNRIKYPSHLTPPIQPEEPDVDPNFVQLAGLEELLDGETVEVVGDRIEQVLI